MVLKTAPLYLRAACSIVADGKVQSHGAEESVRPWCQNIKNQKEDLRNNYIKKNTYNNYNNNHNKKLSKCTTTLLKSHLLGFLKPGLVMATMHAAMSFES